MSKTSKASKSPRDVWMRSQLLVAALHHVRGKGGDGGALIRRFGLPEDVETHRDATLPLETFRRFFEEVSRAIDDPLLGVHLARGVDRGTFGLLSFSPRLAPTAREALARIARYARLANDTVAIAFDESNDAGVLRQRIPGHPTCLGRHANEFFVALVVEEGRRLVGAAASPEEVWFAHDAPRGVSLERELGVPRVSFGAGENGLRFSRTMLDLRLPSYDPSLLAYLDAQAARDLASKPEGPGLLVEVRRVVRARLPLGPPELATTARALSISGRTLQRRLGEVGTSFQDLVEDVREELARAYVVDPSRPLPRVAELLGYADVRSFLRAFRRWTGLSPVKYRARAGGG
jgi:AraC-like DNA-binding protein